MPCVLSSVLCALRPELFLTPQPQPQPPSQVALRHCTVLSLDRASCVVRPFIFIKHHLGLFKLPIKLHLIMSDLKLN
jgi:hypothetical protein